MTRVALNAARVAVISVTVTSATRFVPPPTRGAVPTLAESPLKAWGGEAGRVDDTLVVQLRTIDGDPTPAELPLMRARLASYVAESPSFATKKGGLFYPTNAGRAGVENEGEIQVIVGSDGNAVMTSTQGTRVDWRDFVSAMRRSIAESVYQPAMSNGCAVPSVAIERFSFSVQRLSSQ